MAIKGHRNFPAHRKALLDVVPVDLVAAALIGAARRQARRGADRVCVFVVLQAASYGEFG